MCEATHHLHDHDLDVCCVVLCRLQVQLKQLFDLYIRTEALRDQEVRFKATCKAQLAELEDRLTQLHSDVASGESAGRLADLKVIYAEAVARLQRAKAVVAEKTREISRLARLIDEVPSQAELLQYERRFVELFDLVRAAAAAGSSHTAASMCMLLLHDPDCISSSAELHPPLHLPRAGRLYCSSCAVSPLCIFVCSGSVQVSEKLDETRKYFTIYNTLARKREFLTKEEGLVSSMVSNFPALKVCSLLPTSCRHALLTLSPV